MRVLFLPGWYPSPAHATLGNFVQRHAQAVVRQYPVTVLHAVVVPGTQRPALHVHKQGDLEERIITVPAGPTQSVRRWQAWTKALQDLAPQHDIAHGHVLHASALPLRAARKRFDLPTIVTEHWTGYHNGGFARLPWPLRWLARQEGAAAHCIAPVSEHLGRAMRQVGINGNFHAVPNVVDTTLFHPPVGERPGSPFRYLHVSTLDEAQKNISGLLTAFRKLLDQRPASILELVSDSDLGPAHAWAQQLGIPAEKLHAHGPLSLGQVAERMRAADAFVLFSNHENMPCVILEAFASGVPVVSSQVGGIAEVLTPERGLLVDAGDTEGLTEALLTVHDHPQRFDPGAMRAHIVATAAQDAIARAYGDLYAQALA